MEKTGIIIILMLGFFLNIGFTSFGETFSTKEESIKYIEKEISDFKKEIIVIIPKSEFSKDFEPEVIQLLKESYYDSSYTYNIFKSAELSMWEYNNNCFEIKYTIHYRTTKEEIKKSEEKAKEVVEKIIKPGMSDIEKYETIRNYVLNELEYDTTLKNNTLYDAFFKKRVVCHGYAQMIDILCKESGLKSSLVLGDLNKIRHTWNRINLNGVWYYFDETTNDVNNEKYVYKLTETKLKNIKDLKYVVIKCFDK